MDTLEAALGLLGRCLCLPLTYPDLQAEALAQALSSLEPTRTEQPLQFLVFSLNAHDSPSPDKADQPRGSSSGRWEDLLQMREPLYQSRQGLCLRFLSRVTCPREAERPAAAHRDGPRAEPGGRLRLRPLHL